MDGIPNDDVDLAVLVHMLTVHRDAQVSGPWLRLSSSVPGISEEDFWQSQETQDRIIRIDSWGLATGLFINMAYGKFFYQDDQRAANIWYAKFMVASTLGLQVVQAVWLRVSRCRHAYMRHRHRITLLQRSLRVALGLISLLFVPMHHKAGWLLHGAGANSKSSQRKFSTALLIYPMTALFNAVNHALPFRSQIFFVILKAAVDLTLGVPQWIDTCKRYGLGKHAQELCVKAESGFLIIARLMSPQPHNSICGPHAMDFVHSFVFMVIGVLLPLHLTYWYELRCKARYVQAHIMPPGAPRRLALPPPAHPAEMAVYVLASLVLCWALCSMWAIWQVDLRGGGQGAA